VRTLISHPMESGQRRDGDGNIIPRSIINRFTCDFNGENVIDVTWNPRSRPTRISSSKRS
jgi:sulfur-oxidizing protein SoxZ